MALLFFILGCYGFTTLIVQSKIMKPIRDFFNGRVNFVYELLNFTDINADPMKGESNFTSLTSGNITIDGVDYLTWTGGNDAAFNLCAIKLGLTIINNKFKIPCR